MYSSLNQVKSSIIWTGFLLTLVLFVLPGLGLKYYYSAVDPGMTLAAKFIVSRILFWLWLIAIYFYVIRKEKQPFLLWSEKAYSAGFYVSSVLLILLISFTGNICLYLFLSRHGYYASSLVREVYHLSTPVKLLAILTAAFVEELIFRGYLLPRLQLFFKNIYLPVIISAILFGLAHASWGTVINMVGPLFSGLVLAYHYSKYQNIRILFICHFLIDSILLLRH